MLLGHGQLYGKYNHIFNYNLRLTKKALNHNVTYANTMTYILPQSLDV